MAFLFMPINIAAYAFLPREKNNAASGLMNLARNIGGSFGISFVTTMLARRAQVHQVRLVEKLNAANPQFQSALRGMTRRFLRAAAPGLVPEAIRAAACLRPDPGECDPAVDHAGLHRQFLGARRS